MSSTTTRHPVRRLAAALGLSTARVPAPVRPTGSSPAPALRHAAGDDLTTELARLHDEHVERVNAAVGEGRDDLLQELSDSYVEQAMSLMTAAGLPPARAAEQLAA
jgi:hypothetical protein